MKRPRTAAKCPRINITMQSDLCSQCQHFQAENQELKEANRVLTEQLNQLKESASADQKLPKPGKVPHTIAQNHKVSVVYIEQKDVPSGLHWVHLT